MEDRIIKLKTEFLTQLQPDEKLDEKCCPKWQMQIIIFKNKSECYKNRQEQSRFCLFFCTIRD